MRSVPRVVTVATILIGLAGYSFGVSSPVRPGLAAGASPSPSPTTTATPTFRPTPTPTLTPPPTRTPTPSPTATPGVHPPIRDGQYVVLLVIDGGQPGLLSSPKLPHIHALIRHGTVYDQAYVGQMESVTPSVHVTLGTGTLPRENGFMGFTWVSPDTRQPVDFRTLLADGQIDPVLKTLPVPSVASRLHGAMPDAISIAASGHKDYAAVGLGGGGADYVIYGGYTATEFVPSSLPGHVPPPLTAAERASLSIPRNMPLGAEDAWAIRYATTVARHVTPRLLMINLPEVDTWGHWDGPANQGVFDRLMTNIDRGIGQIESTYRALGILKQTDFIITADHSMMESRPVHNWRAIVNVAHSVGTQWMKADPDGGAIWLADPGKAEAMARAIARMHPAHVEAVFYRAGTGADLHYALASPVSWLTGPPEARALQHLVDTTAGVHAPDVWVLYRESYTAVPRNDSGKWKGTHGGATWDVQHIPLIISGIGVRAGVHSAFPAESIDIAPTLERLLGLSAVKRDGVALADALTDPSTTDVRAQRAVAGARTADVRALQSQSAADLAPHPSSVWVPPPVPPIYPCAIKRPGCTSSPSPTNQ